VSQLLPSVPRSAQGVAEARRERKLAQSSMEELWRMLYKYSAEPNAEKAERIEGHPNDAARRREAVSELVALTRGRCVSRQNMPG